MSDESEPNPAPIYITVGPMCSGKTTLLSSLSIKDITIDDQDGVYQKIHYQSFLDPSFEDGDIVFNRTMNDRVKCPTQNELKLIIQRLLGAVSPVDFRRELQNVRYGKGDVMSDLISAVEEFISRHPQYTIPDDFHVDLFIPEAIFQPKSGALVQAQAKLSSLSAARDVPISWGNTNTKPRDYEIALQMAEHMNRPVQFVVYAPLQDILPAQSVAFLPQLQRKTLFFRNIQRFAQTGRYINASSMASAEQRCKLLVETALNEIVPLTVLERIQWNIKSKNDLLFELDAALCALGGFEMNLKRMVRRVGRPRDIGINNSYNSTRSARAGPPLTVGRRATNNTGRNFVSRPTDDQSSVVLGKRNVNEDQLVSTEKSNKLKTEKKSNSEYALVTDEEKVRRRKPSISEENIEKIEKKTKSKKKKSSKEKAPDDSNKRSLFPVEKKTAKDNNLGNGSDENIAKKEKKRKKNKKKSPKEKLHVTDDTIENTFSPDEKKTDMEKSRSEKIEGNKEKKSKKEHETDKDDNLVNSSGKKRKKKEKKKDRNISVEILREQNHDVIHEKKRKREEKKESKRKKRAK